MLGLHQMSWDHAEDIGPFGQGRARNVTHDPDIARAIDQPPAARGDQGAQRPCILGVGCRQARPRATEDADRQRGIGHDFGLETKCFATG